MTDLSASASFERGIEPSAKRARFEPTDIAPEPVAEVAVGGDGQSGEDEVHITVPQTQFEIEINSGSVDDEDDDMVRETILQQDLNGPAFAITTASQDLHSLSALSPRACDDAVGEADGRALNAIGRALIQMQQTGNGASGQQGSAHQLILTSPQGEIPQGNSSPLYVMIPPSSSAEILQAMGQSRPIAPKGVSTVSDAEGVSGNREAQRKATHNEVERRRRDRINDMIKTLAQIVPGCQKKDSTTGNVVGYVYSKGTVLDKTVEYLKDLIVQNNQLSTTAKLAEKSANALTVLQNQITVLEKENAFLRAQIIQLGIDATTSSQTAALSRHLLSSPLTGLLTPPPPPPSLSLPSSSTHTAAQQLILSLAQTLSGSPLLGQGVPPPVSFTPSPSTPPKTHNFSGLTPSQLVSSLTSGSPSLPTLTSMPPIASSLSTPILTSLVQTLASIASTSTTPSMPLPKVTPLPAAPPPSLPMLGSQPQGSISATAAAANLLNTLLLAQNVLNTGTTSSGQLEGSNGVASSVLNTVTVETEPSTS